MWAAMSILLSLTLQTAPRRPKYEFARCGTIDRSLAVLLSSVVLVVVLTAILFWKPSQQAGEPLVVYAAASLRQPLDAIARSYEKETGTQVQVQYGGSQTLLANIKLSKTGDVYVPADESYIELARRDDLVEQTVPLARMHPVLVVEKGNPHKISSLDDLLTRELKISQGDPDAGAIGKLTRDVLRKLGKWESLRAKTTVFKITVNDVGNDLKVGAADAGIIWDSLMPQYPTVEVVPTPEFEGVTARILAAVLSTGQQRPAAVKFAEYLGAADKGLIALKKAGFEVESSEPAASAGANP